MAARSALMKGSQTRPQRSDDWPGPRLGNPIPLSKTTFSIRFPSGKAQALLRGALNRVIANGGA